MSTGVLVTCEGCNRTCTADEYAQQTLDEVRRFKLSRENSREGSALFVFSPAKNNLAATEHNPIAVLRCGHAICAACADSQKAFIPKVHKQGAFVCFACGLRHKADIFQKKYLRATASAISDSEFLGDFQERIGSGEKSLDFCEDRLEQSLKQYADDAARLGLSSKIPLVGSRRESVGLLGRPTTNHDLRIPTSFASSRCHSIIEASDDGPSRPHESVHSTNQDLRPKEPMQLNFLDLKIPQMYPHEQDFDFIGEAIRSNPSSPVMNQLRTCQSSRREHRASEVQGELPLSARDFPTDPIKPDKEGSDRTIRRKVGRADLPLLENLEIPLAGLDSQVTNQNTRNVSNRPTEFVSQAGSSQFRLGVSKEPETDGSEIGRLNAPTILSLSTPEQQGTDTLTINGELRLQICMKSLEKLIKNEQNNMGLFASGRKQEQPQQHLSRTPAHMSNHLTGGFGVSTSSLDDPISPMMPPESKALKHESEINLLPKNEGSSSNSVQPTFGHRGSLSTENIQGVTDLMEYKHLMRSDVVTGSKMPRESYSGSHAAQKFEKKVRTSHGYSAAAKDSSKPPFPNYQPPEFKYINRFKTLVLNRKGEPTSRMASSQGFSQAHRDNSPSSLLRVSQGNPLVTSLVNTSGYMNSSSMGRAARGSPDADNPEPDTSALPLSEKFSKLFEKPRYNLHLQSAGSKAGFGEQYSAANNSQHLEFSHLRQNFDSQSASLGLIAQKIDSHSKAIEEYQRRKASASPIVAAAQGSGLMSTFSQKAPAYLASYKVPSNRTSDSTAGLQVRNTGVASSRSRSNPHSGYLDMFRSARPSPRTNSRGVKSINSSANNSQSYVPRSLIAPTAAALVSKLVSPIGKQVFTSPVSSVPQSTKGWKKTEVYSYLNASKSPDNYVGSQ